MRCEYGLLAIVAGALAIDLLAGTGGQTTRSPADPRLDAGLVQGRPGFARVLARISGASVAEALAALAASGALQDPEAAALQEQDAPACRAPWTAAAPADVDHG